MGAKVPDPIAPGFENIWATQKAMATLFDVNVPAISKHLKNIFESGELKDDSVVSKMEITASHFGRRTYLILVQKSSFSRE